MAASSSNSAGITGYKRLWVSASSVLFFSKAGSQEIVLVHF
jgi:hypothetical protein